jgi:hypothetical protein
MEEMKPLNKECIYYLIGTEAMVNLKYVKSIFIEPLGGKTCITATYAKDRIILDKGPKAYIEEKYKEYCKQIIMMQTQYVVI